MATLNDNIFGGDSEFFIGGCGCDGGGSDDEYDYGDALNKYAGGYLGGYLGGYSGGSLDGVFDQLIEPFKQISTDVCKYGPECLIITSILIGIILLIVYFFSESDAVTTCLYVAGGLLATGVCLRLMYSALSKSSSFFNRN